MTRTQAIVLTLISVTSGAMLACNSERSDRGQYGRSNANSAVSLDQATAVPMRANAPRETAAKPRADSISLATTVADAAPPGTLPAISQALPATMLIRQGTASVQVDSLDSGIFRVRDMARRLGGFVANTEMQTGKDELHSASIELRLPSARFDDAVNGLSPIGKLESVNVNVADVGEEYVDVDARMTNARRLEQRLIDLLARRTGKLADVLSVEHELARVREEIERYEGRMRYLRTRASVSTLTVTVHESAPLVSPPGQTPIRDALRQSWRNFVDLLAGIIASLGVLIPLGVLLGGVVWVGRKHLPWNKPPGAPVP
jgi:Domain of unknown function (DUF4349)